MISAAPYLRSVIGKPYVRGAAGPDAYDCFGLARSALLCMFGKDLPVSPSQALRGSWRRLQVPQDGAVVLMGVSDKHVGLYIAQGVLHAMEGVGVVHDDLMSLKLRGFSRLRFYIAT